MNHSSSTKTAEVIIIGGGVIGCAIAHYLSRAGLKPLLLEASALASGSSGACDGMVNIQSKKLGLPMEMALASRDLFGQLVLELETDIQYRTTGGLVVMENEKQQQAMENYLTRRVEYGLEMTMLDSAALRELEPHLAPELTGAAFTPLDGLVNPMSLTHGLALAATRAGAEILVNQKVVGLSRTNGKWLVKTARQSFESPLVINAAGSWAPQIGKMIGLDIPIQPRRGQLLVTGQSPTLLHHPLLTAEYVAAKYDPKLAIEAGMGVSMEQTEAGTMLLGSTREFAGYDQRTTLEGLAGVARRVAAIMPRLQEMSIIRTFAGLRPYTPDGLPIFGPVPGREGFIMAAGHEGAGISLAPVTGKLIAQFVTTGQTDLPLDELSLARFNKPQGEES